MNKNTIVLQLEMTKYLLAQSQYWRFHDISLKHLRDVKQMPPLPITTHETMHKCIALRVIALSRSTFNG